MDMMVEELTIGGGGYLVQDDFWSNIFRGATESPRLAAGVDVLGEAKVDHLDVALLVKKQVLRLEISVDDSSVVEVLKSAHLKNIFLTQIVKHCGRYGLTTHAM